MPGFLNLLLAGGAPLVDAVDVSASTVNNSPTDAFAGFRYDNLGDARKSAANATAENYSTIVGPWLLQGAVADYNIRVTQNSGDALDINAGLSTDLSLATTRSWGYLITVSAGIKQGNFTISLKLAATGDVLDTVVSTLYCEVAI